MAEVLVARIGQPAPERGKLHGAELARAAARRQMEQLFRLTQHHTVSDGAQLYTAPNQRKPLTTVIIAFAVPGERNCGSATATGPALGGVGVQ